jgi:hypothetical protein
LVLNATSMNSIDVPSRSTFDSEHCKAVKEAWLTPMESDELCKNLLEELSAQQFKQVCLHSCFSQYISGYETSFSEGCLNPEVLPPRDFRKYMCGFQGSELVEFLQKFISFESKLIKIIVSCFTFNST